MYKGQGWYLREIDLKSKKNFDILDFSHRFPEKYPYLLESSATGNIDLARYSIAFFKPNIVLKKIKGDTRNFLNEFDEIWIKTKVSQSNYFHDKQTHFPFLGGWFLYLGYELVKEIEPSITLPDSPYQIPTALAARAPSAVIYDKKLNKLFFITDNEPACIEEMLDDFYNLKKKCNSESFLKRNYSVNLVNQGTKDEHCKDVKKCIDFIFDGEIFQANLSRLWEFVIDKDLKSTEIYKILRKSNPSPFGGLVMLPEGSIISSSPERLVRVDKEKLETRPIAGTRPRGVSALTDIHLSNELISSTKERAEHLMLVDLERNDISRVCKPGSVKVNEMMIVESYAHVHHIVSNIVGKLKKKINPGKIISAIFPGGTITGCPKVRCMEILGELEKIGRGPYTGSFGYVTHSGDLDLNILIRSMVLENKKISLRAGGGIVADSIPEKETLETEAKANGMLIALKLLQ